jgi:hypothetical protein
VDPVGVAIIHKLFQLLFQVSSIPEKNLIQILPLDCTDEPFREWLGHSDIYTTRKYAHLTLGHHKESIKKLAYGDFFGPNLVQLDNDGDLLNGGEESK